MIQLNEKLDKHEPQATVLPGGKRSYQRRHHLLSAITGLRKMGYDYFNIITDDPEHPYILEYKATDIAMHLCFAKMVEKDLLTADQLNRLIEIRDNLNPEYQKMLDQALSKIEQPRLRLRDRLSNWFGWLVPKRKQTSTIEEQPIQADKIQQMEDTNTVFCS